MGKSRRAVPGLLRTVVSISILVAVLWKMSFADVLERAKNGAPGPLAAALCLILFTAVLVALRWRALARWFGLALPLSLAARAVFLGWFGAQILPATVGSDLVRGGVLARHTGSLRAAAASIIADRLVALFAACMLLAFTLPFLGDAPMPLAGLLAPVAVLASGALLLAFLAASASPLGRVLSAGMPIVAALLLALAIHAIAVLAAAVTAAAYGIDASPATWLAIIPASVIACAIPISVNGWGIREAVIVALAARHGIAEADALVVSLTLGGLNVIASLPGAYVLLAGQAGLRR